MNPEFGKTLVSTLYQATGIQGVLDALRRVQGSDLEKLKPLIEQVIPGAIVERGADWYELEIHLRTHALLRKTETREFVLVGPPDLALLRALAAARFRGVLRVILSGHIERIDAERIRRNVPPSLQIEFELPIQRLPALRIDNTIIVIGFDAGANMMLVDRHAPSVISQMVGRRDNGSARLLQPATTEPIFERTSVLTAAGHTLFYSDDQNSSEFDNEPDMLLLQQIRES